MDNFLQQSLSTPPAPQEKVSFHMVCVLWYRFTCLLGSLRKDTTSSLGLGKLRHYR